MENVDVIHLMPKPHANWKVSFAREKKTESDDERDFDVTIGIIQ